jgi:hypothetical protein
VATLDTAILNPTNHSPNIRNENMEVPFHKDVTVISRLQRQQLDRIPRKVLYGTSSGIFGESSNSN